MFNYIKFGMFLMSYEQAPDVAGGTLEIDANKSKIFSETKTELSKVKLEIESLNERISQIQKELSVVGAGTKVVSDRVGSLGKKIAENIPLVEMAEDGAYELSEKERKLRTELLELQDRKKILERSLELSGVNKLSESDIQKMKKITNKEFLSFSPNERLKYVTKGNVNNSDVKEGGVTNLEFTFTFDGEFNRDFYLRTTAGQVINESVRVVESDGVTYTRKGYNGEFFADNGKRLIIHEGTKVNVTKFGTLEELKEIESINLTRVESFKESPYKDLALESVKKGYDPKFIVSVFGSRLDKLSGLERQVEIEDILSDIARVQDDFNEDYSSENVEFDGKISEKFAGYVVNILLKDNNKVDEVFNILSKEYGFNIDTLKQTRRVNNVFLGGGPIDMSNISINIDKDYPNGVESLLSKKIFRPGSKDSVMLFTVACQASGIPIEWARSQGLHEILRRESGGVVGALNFKLKGETTSSFKDKAVSVSGKNPDGLKFTASGLGQCTLSNVDKYYPDGRNGIGDPLNEAVGMLRYIKDRYGSTDIAWSMYGKTGYYNHPVKGSMYKSFEEGY